MTTQHQAPEVTSELRECPFCGHPGDISSDGGKWRAGCSGCYCMVGEAYGNYGQPDHIFETEAEARSAWNTRATQPLSLTVDEIRDVLEPFAKMGRMLDGPFAPVLFKDEDAIGMGAAWSENGEPRTITFGDLRRAKAALNRLQSLSLPVAGEQIAENANCSGTANV